MITYYCILNSHTETILLKVHFPRSAMDKETLFSFSEENSVDQELGGATERFRDTSYTIFSRLKYRIRNGF